MKILPNKGRGKGPERFQRFFFRSKYISKIAKRKTQGGEVSETWDKGYKVKKNMADFFLKSSLVYLGTSPDTIGKIS